MDAELKQYLDEMEGRFSRALIDLRDGLSGRLNAGFDQMNRRFDGLEARFDAQDRLLDRQDVVLDRWIRAMDAHFERMDKRDASRPS